MKGESAKVMTNIDKPHFAELHGAQVIAIQIIQVSKAATWAARSEGGKKRKGRAEKTEKGVNAGLTAGEEQSYFW